MQLHNEGREEELCEPSELSLAKQTGATTVHLEEHCVWAQTLRDEDLYPPLGK